VKCEYSEMPGLGGVFEAKGIEFGLEGVRKDHGSTFSDLDVTNLLDYGITIFSTIDLGRERRFIDVTFSQASFFRINAPSE